MRVLPTSWVADAVGVPPYTLLRKARLGEIPGTRTSNGRWLFDLDEVRDALRRQEQGVYDQGARWDEPADQRAARWLRTRRGRQAAPAAGGE